MFSSILLLKRPIQSSVSSASACTRLSFVRIQARSVQQKKKKKKQPPPAAVVVKEEPFQRQNLAVVSICGPPNAGKSTLFNRFLDKESNRAYKLAIDRPLSGRLTGASLSKKTKKTSNNKSKSSSTSAPGSAIVSAVAGTTRDRRECIGRIGGTYFRLTDTAGIDGERLDAAQDSFYGKMVKQTLQAAKESDLILFMFDARVGLTADMAETARQLRKVSPRRVLVLANKLEGDHWNYDGSVIMEHLSEAMRLGFGEPVPISAIHGEGMADIAVEIEKVNAEKAEAVGNQEQSTTEKPLQLAICGMPNVGKSTLVNSLLKQERVIVGPTPGLTRDAIAVDWTWNGRPVQLVDTAGIRKRSQRDYDNAIEDMAVDDALRALKVADVVVLVIDAGTLMLRRQELAIADAVLKEGRSLVIAANKMDLIVDAEYSKEEFETGVRDQLETRFPMLRMTPIVAMSSLTGEAVEELMPVAFDARDRWARKVSTGQLNRWLKDVMQGHPPPPVQGKTARIKYVMQTKGRPPTFLLFCNCETLPDTYIRFLTRNFQDTFKMYGMEVRMAVKQSAVKNPYDSGKKRGGTGIGGKPARVKRILHSLKTTGTVPKRNRRRKSKH